jgi:putative transposase
MPGLRPAAAQGRPPLWVRLDRDVPYPAGGVWSLTLVAEGGRLFVDVTGEVAVASYPPGREPDPGRCAAPITAPLMGPLAGRSPPHRT